jgi:hypothetical protein
MPRCGYRCDQSRHPAADHAQVNLMGLRFKTFDLHQHSLLYCPYSQAVRINVRKFSTILAEISLSYGPAEGDRIKRLPFKTANNRSRPFMTI